MNSSRTNLRGFTLIEIMIALTLGLILTAGVIVMFTVNSSTQRVVQENSRLQENARFALNEIMLKLRMVNFSGCNSNIDFSNTKEFLNTADISASKAFYNDIASNGMMNVYKDSIGLPAAISSDNAITEDISGIQSDMLVIRGVDDQGAQLMTAQSGGTDGDIQIANTGYVAKEDTLFIADCEKTALFQAGNVSNSASTSTISLSQPISNTDIFYDDAILYQYQVNIFYVGNSDIKNSKGQPIPTLYQKTNSDDPFELAQGISDLNFSFGIDTDDDGKPNKFVNADEVSASEWIKVTVIKVQVTAVPIEDIGMRTGRVFFATVSLRN
ncbi:PilW family protein [Gynuella sunshinyii]|uniref:Tfp pilus assembly protein PilW n=1 Tax=Gynuella sunshinyii YC6258 TaxID=1445510 RepID=A0A0C5VDL8_9GAMM|nr:PilW family protein [Gynuella sunshinyii]AJQ97425.1 tfp pilus assembly protein PilW [Gynuella sunshinyii YC6258]